MRNLLLVLLTFAIPSFASTIDYASEGSVKAGTAHVTGAPKAGQVWSVTDILDQIDSTGVVTGNLGTVDITTGTIAKCVSGLCFNGGSVDIVSLTGKTLLNATFLSGTIITSNNGTTFLNATFTDGGTTEIASKSGVFSSNTVVNRVGTTIPEPSALLLAGTGIMALSFLRRKLC